MPRCSVPWRAAKPGRTAISTCWWNWIRTSPMGIFEYARLKIYVNEILHGAGDVVNRRILKPLLRDNILHDAVYASKNPAQRLRDIVDNVDAVADSRRKWTSRPSSRIARLCMRRSEEHTSELQSPMYL